MSQFDLNPGGGDVYQASREEIALADFAAIVTADFPGRISEVLDVLSDESLSLEEQYKKIVDIDDKALFVRRTAMSTVEIEEVSSWSPSTQPVHVRQVGSEQEVDKNRQPRAGIIAIGRMTMASSVFSMYLHWKIHGNLLVHDDLQKAVELSAFAFGAGLSFGAKRYL